MVQKRRRCRQLIRSGEVFRERFMLFPLYTRSGEYHTQWQDELYRISSLDLNISLKLNLVLSLKHCTIHIQSTEALTHAELLSSSQW